MLDTRKKKILESLIKEYTKTAEPVGSLYLLKKYDFGISGATMRNELSLLEKQGYLYHPYTSSGRVPTDKGYRYFVESLMKKRNLSKNEQSLIQQELLKLRVKNTRLARTTAKLLAAFSKNLAISGLIEEEEYFQSGIRDFLSQPEFTKVDEVCKAVEMLDYLDENVDKLLSSLQSGETRTLIGRENPLAKTEGCSLVVSKIRFPQGHSGLLAIMGPKRMNYDKNISLIDYVSKILET
ncbi:MAG: hypothetical protein GF335_04220 [Candidatus Moranbacteria bacterium]|nr:hypothetical protein [Candidatus Moranbacteria bacterium]